MVKVIAAIHSALVVYAVIHPEHMSYLMDNNFACSKQQHVVSLFFRFKLLPGKGRQLPVDA